MSVDDYSSFKGLVEYFVRGYYVATYKSAVEMRVGNAADDWYNGTGHISPFDAQHIRRVQTNHLRIPQWFDLWKETQEEQKKTRLIESFVNGGHDPFPSGFLEPWIALSIAEKESPLLTLKRLMAHSEAMIRLILPSVTKASMSATKSRDSYRLFISTLLDEKWIPPPPVDTTAILYPASAVEETFYHWKGKVTLPLGCWIGKDEIAYICSQVCSETSVDVNSKDFLV